MSKTNKNTELDSFVYSTLDIVDDIVLAKQIEEELEVEDSSLENIMFLDAEVEED